MVRASANHHLIPFFAADLHAHQSEVADVVLGAGVIATGDVEIDWPIEKREVRVEMMSEGDGVGLGIRGSEATALIAGTCDCAAKDGTCFVVETSGVEGCLCCFELLCRDIRNEKVLPDGEADFSAAESIGNVRDGTHLFYWKAPDRNDHADVMEAVLNLGVDSDMACTIDGSTRFALGGGDVNEREGEEFLSLREELRNAPVVDEILQAGLFAIRSVPMLPEDADHRCCDRDGLIRT